MNKVILGICLFVLVLCLVNTALLIQMGGKMKDIGEKIEPVAKSVEQIEAGVKGGPKKSGTPGGGSQKENKKQIDPQDLFPKP